MSKIVNNIGSTNQLIVELTLQLTAIKLLMVKKGLFTDEEFELECKEVESKVAKLKGLFDDEAIKIPEKAKPPAN